MATAVGLDIGTHAIKIAEVRKTRHATTLVRLGNRATPLGATRSGVIVKPKEVAAEISALLRELRLRPQNVVTAVAGQGVILRSLLMPQMSRDEMAEAVRWEVDGQLPFRVDECVYDFDIVGEVFDHSIGQVKQRVSLVAAKKEIVDSYIETLRFCRILPKVIDVQPFGIVRSLSMRECWAYMAQETAQSELLNERGLRTGAAGQTRPDWNNGEGLLPGLDDLEHMSVEQLRTLADELESGTAGSAEPVSAGQYRATGDIAAGSEGKRDPQSCMVVLDIGAGTTDLVVLCGDELTFTRIIPMGGNDVTEAIENAVSCSREDAERLKSSVRYDGVNSRIRMA
jgi:Tfp pilus assembly PilM family ATPase